MALHLHQMNRLVAHKLNVSLTTISDFASPMVRKHAAILGSDVIGAFARITNEGKNMSCQIDEACETPLIRSTSPAVA